MGNQTGPSSSSASQLGGPGIQSFSDLQRQYAVEADKSERVDHWEVMPGSRKKDGFPVAVFRHVKSGSVNDELASWFSFKLFFFALAFVHLPLMIALTLPLYQSHRQRAPNGETNAASSLVDVSGRRRV